MNVLDTGGLGADITLAQYIVVVTAHSDNLLAIVFDLYAAHGFAEVAGSVVELVHPVSPLRSFR